MRGLESRLELEPKPEWLLLPLGGEDRRSRSLLCPDCLQSRLRVVLDELRGLESRLELPELFDLAWRLL